MQLFHQNNNYWLHNFKMNNAFITNVENFNKTIIKSPFDQT